MASDGDGDVVPPECWPFFHPSAPMNVRDRLLMVCMLVLVPIRVWIALTYYVGYTVMLWIVFYGRNVHDTRTLQGWRSRFVRDTLRTVGPWLIFGSTGVIWSVRGKPDPSAPTIASSHVSYLDSFIWLMHCAPAFVAKIGVRDVPFIGLFCSAMGAVYVGNALDGSQGAVKSGTERVMAKQRDIHRRIQRTPGDPCEVPRLLLYPEGTTTNGRAVMRFRRGAFASGLPVQPVAFAYTGGARFSSTWESVPLTWHLLRQLTHPVTRVRVHWLPVYTPSLAEQSDPQLYADGVQQVIADALGVPAMRVTMEHKKAYHASILSGQRSWQALAAAWWDKGCPVTHPPPSLLMNPEQ